MKISKEIDFVILCILCYYFGFNLVLELMGYDIYDFSRGINEIF